MNKNKSFNKSILLYILIGIVAILFLWPASSEIIQEGLMKIGILPTQTEKTTSNTDTNQGTESSMVLLESVSLSNQEGNIIQTQNLTGKVVFINFWATWCGPCRAEMPSIQKLYDKYKDNDQVEFLLVEIEKDHQGAEAFLKEESLNLPIYFPESPIPQAWLSDAIPSTVVLNKQGHLAFDHKGMADYSSKEFEDFLITLINQ